MALNVAQYLAPLNSAQVLTGYTQGVKQGIGVSIAADGTISLNPAGAASLGFLTSSITPAPVYAWPTGSGNANSILTNDGSGNLTWDTNYVPTITTGENFPHTGAAVIPAGTNAARPASSSAGCIRYNTSLGYLEFFNGSAWLPFSPDTGGVFSFVSTSTPTANAAGDIWLDTNTNQAKIWTGTTWTPTTPIATSLVPGRVIIGSNVQVAADGTISILTTTGVSGGVSNTGVTTITDNVLSSSIDSALSANQGRLLQDQISALLIATNLTFAGIIAGTGVLTYVTAEGTLQGFVVGSVLPTASSTNDEYFVIVESAGGFTPPGGAFTVVTQGDWFVSSSNIWEFLNVGYDPPAASTTTAGIVQLATDSEVQAGSNSTKAVTPSSLASRTATTGRTGLAALATQALVNAGTDDTTIVTPLKLATVFSSGSINATNIGLNPTINGNTTVQAALNDAIYDVASSGATITVTETATGQVNVDVTQATETQTGGAQIATDVETQALALDTVIITPKKLGNLFSSGAIDATDVLLNPSLNGNTTVQSALADAIYDISSSNSSISITETATGQVSIISNQATETLLAGAEIATQTETNAGTSDTTIVTPLKLATRTATETLTGIAELATQTETNTGTDDARIVTPLKLRTATVYKSDFTTKGSILSASAASTPSLLSAGVDGLWLTTDSTTTTGLKWSSPGFVNIDDVSTSFDGVTTSFALKIGGVGYTPTTSTNLMVFVGGVAQIPGASNAYTISGSNISFTTAPPTGASFYGVTVK